ncbi:hypothetical protein HaLaN_20438 [Haematococcus lacustris]|uniref:Uncharacterized protein n=1 Tax=Haematococcus lacustris TaxID=44745 RepID=A0A699ZJF2_HAELA|nr:hypothetical protein HaLaN_20438 [Haematococcus lacustris]
MREQSSRLSDALPLALGVAPELLAPEEEDGSVEELLAARAGLLLEGGRGSWGSWDRQGLLGASQPTGQPDTVTEAMPCTQTGVKPLVMREQSSRLSDALPLALGVAPELLAPEEEDGSVEELLAARAGLLLEGGRGSRGSWDRQRLVGASQAAGQPDTATEAMPCTQTGVKQPALAPGAQERKAGSVCSALSSAGQAGSLLELTSFDVAGLAGQLPSGAVAGPAHGQEPGLGLLGVASFAARPTALNTRPRRPVSANSTGSSGAHQTGIAKLSQAAKAVSQLGISLLGMFKRHTSPTRRHTMTGWGTSSGPWAEGAAAPRPSLRPLNVEGLPRHLSGKELRLLARLKVCAGACIEANRVTATLYHSISSSYTNPNPARC